MASWFSKSPPDTEYAAESTSDTVQLEVVGDTPPPFEVTTEQITDLSVFQVLLPTPKEVQPKDRAEQQKVQQGEKLFQANCASCHISRLPLNKAEVTIEGAMGQKDTKVDLEEILPKQNDKY